LKDLKFSSEYLKQFPLIVFQFGKNIYRKFVDNKELDFILWFECKELVLTFPKPKTFSHFPFFPAQTTRKRKSIIMQIHNYEGLIFTQSMAEILSKCDPKSLSPTLYLEKFISFIQQQFSNNGNPFVPLGGESHFPFKIDFHDLVQYDSALAFNILYHPKLLLPLFDDALNTCISHLYRETALFGHVRICHLPPVSNVIKASISEIKPSDGDNLIQVCGTVVSTGGIRMLEVSRQFECLNPKCKHQFRVYADNEQDSVIIHPKSCPNLMLDGNRCNSSVLRELENGRICVDFQEIKVQDKVDNLTTGIIPRTITIHLQADLADKCLPGNDVVIVGYVLRKWRYLSKNYRGSIDIVLFANSINFFEEEESYKYSSETNTERFSKFWSHYKPLNGFDGRNIIIKSVCPQLHGMHFAKLSLLLALIGGCTCEATGATEKRRSNIHLLFAGDPGCGKNAVQ
jgi:DNA helicase MCM9